MPDEGGRHQKSQIGLHNSSNDNKNNNNGGGEAKSQRRIRFDKSSRVRGLVLLLESTEKSAQQKNGWMDGWRLLIDGMIGIRSHDLSRPLREVFRVSAIELGGPLRLLINIVGGALGHAGVFFDLKTRRDCFVVCQPKRHKKMRRDQRSLIIVVPTITHHCTIFSTQTFSIGKQKPNLSRHDNDSVVSVGRVYR